MPFIALALIVSAALGGGTAVAAQNALPGDALWGFKTEINERIQETLATSDKAKAETDIALAQARLDEAQKLHTQGKLTANTQAQLSGNFDAHARDVANRITALQAAGKFSDAADIAARFQATVAGEASTLAELNAQSTGAARVTIGGILQDVQTTLTTASGLSAKASADAAAHGDVSANEDTHLTGSSGASSSDTSDDTRGAQVHTGTSVKGTTGGIKVDSETGATVGI